MSTNSSPEDRFSEECNSSSVDNREEHDSSPVSGQDKVIVTKNWILLDFPQGSDLWKKLRQGRATTTAVGAIAGHNRYDTPADMLDYLSGRRLKTFTARQLQNMKRGTDNEDIARRTYMSSCKVVVFELGLVVSRADDRQGASIDGFVIDSSNLSRPTDEYHIAELALLAEGIIEIKCPGKMYKPLIDHHNREQTVGVVLPSDEEIDNDINIWENHYRHIQHYYFDQMQQGMAILGKPWSDFIVYTPELMMVNRVPFCRTYYQRRLLKPVLSFLDKQLDPILPPGYRVPIPEGRFIDHPEGKDSS